MEKIRIKQNINTPNESKYATIVVIPLFIIIGKGFFTILIDRTSDFRFYNDNTMVSL